MAGLLPACSSGSRTDDAVDGPTERVYATGMGPCVARTCTVLLAWCVLAAVAGLQGCGGRLYGQGPSSDAGGRPDGATTDTEDAGVETTVTDDASVEATVVRNVEDMSPCTTAASCINPAAVCLPANGSLHPVCCLPLGAQESYEYCCSLYSVVVAGQEYCACLEDGGAGGGAPCTDNFQCCSATCSAHPRNVGGDGGTGICF